MSSAVWMWRWSTDWMPCHRLNHGIAAGVARERVEVVPAHPQDVVEASIPVAEIATVGIRAVHAVGFQDAEEAPRLGRIEDHQETVPACEADHVVHAREVGLVRGRQVEVIREGHDPVVGAAVRAPTGVSPAEQIDPDRVEAVLRAIGEEGVGLRFRQIDHQRLWRVARDQERSLALVDQIAAGRAHLDRVLRARRRGPRILERGELRDPARPRLECTGFIGPGCRGDGVRRQLAAPAGARVVAATRSLDPAAVARDGHEEELPRVACVQRRGIERRRLARGGARGVERHQSSHSSVLVHVQGCMSRDRTGESRGHRIHAAGHVARKEDLRTGPVLPLRWTHGAFVRVAFAVREDDRIAVVPDDVRDDQIPRRVGAPKPHRDAPARSNFETLRLYEQASCRRTSRQDRKRGPDEHEQRQQEPKGGQRHVPRKYVTGMLARHPSCPWSDGS